MDLRVFNKKGCAATVLCGDAAPHPRAERDQSAAHQTGRQFDLPLVCDNDSHFLNEEDHDGHHTLICISTGKGKTYRNRMVIDLTCVRAKEQMVEMFTPTT